MDESGNFRQPNEIEEEINPIEKQLARRMSDIFHEGGPLEGYPGYLAENYHLKQAEMGLLEAQIHSYSACLRAAEITPKNSEVNEKTKARLVTAIHNLGEMFIETFANGSVNTENIMEGLEKWKDSINIELEQKSGTYLRIRLPSIFELAEATWMSFEQGGQQVSGVNNWAIMDKDRVLRKAHVETSRG
jgi:hypothetical protein